MINLAIGAAVGLTLDGGKTGLTVAANIASREKPFAVVYSGLGGVGWLSTKFVMSDLGKEASSLTLDAGLGVAAAATIDLGVIKGTAMIALSMDVQTTIWGGSTQIAVGVQFMIRGDVDVLGLIKASVALVVHAEYVKQGGRQVLRGTASFSMRIKLFCFEVGVNETVQYEHVLSAGSSQAPDDVAAKRQLVDVDARAFLEDEGEGAGFRPGLRTADHHASDPTGSTIPPSISDMVNHYLESLLWL